MALFAKLFTFDSDMQVNVTKFYDNETKVYVMHEETFMDETNVHLHHEFDKKVDRDMAFDTYDADRARAFLTQTRITLDDLSGKNRVAGTGFSVN